MKNWRWYVLLLGGIVLVGMTMMNESTAQRTQNTSATSDQRLADEMEIRRVVDEIDNAVDAKDWAACRASTSSTSATIGTRTFWDTIFPE